MSESTYSVYLIEQTHEQGGKREVTSPIQGHDIEFYESGAWLDRDQGRNFFPYEQIRTIREHPEGQGSEGGSRTAESSEGDSADGDSADDQSSEGEPSTSDEAGAAEGGPPEGGDSGAEEEMLEE